MLLTLLALGAAPQARADYYVVVSEKSGVMQLTRQEVLHIYMGRSRHFPNGGPAVALDMPGADARAGFYRALGGMSLAQVTSYWARLVFAGRSLPPQQVEDPARMIARIRQDPAAIGWLPERPSVTGVRTVLVLEETP